VRAIGSVVLLPELERPRERHELINV